MSAETIMDLLTLTAEEDEYFLRPKRIACDRKSVRHRQIAGGVKPSSKSRLQSSLAKPAISCCSRHLNGGS